MWVMQFHAVSMSGESIVGEIDIALVAKVLAGNPPAEMFEAWVTAELYGFAKNVIWEQIGLKRVSRG